MLARTPATLVYLSTEKLGITERERAGLIEVRDDLASGRVKHVDWDSFTSFDERLDPLAPLFCMAYVSASYSCGTAHCIGGFLKARGIVRGDLRRHSMCDLFYPVSVRGWQLLTPAQAVCAIDHFLAGAGPECWSMALADIPL